MHVKDELNAGVVYWRPKIEKVQFFLTKALFYSWKQMQFLQEVQMSFVTVSVKAGN